MILAKDRRAVTTDGGLQHVARVVRVVQTTVERDVAYRCARRAGHVGNAVDVVGIAQVPEVGHIVIEVIDRHSEAVVGRALFPGETSHQSQFVGIADRHVIVAIGLKRLVVAQIGIAVSTSVVAGVHLCLVCLIPAVGVLTAVVGIVGIPVQSVDDVQRSLGDILYALPLVTVVVLVDHRQGVVVGIDAHGGLKPCSVGIANGVGGREVVHGVEHALAALGTIAAAHRHAVEASLHGIQTDGDVQMVFQYAGGKQCAGVDTVHAGSLDHTLAVHIVDRTHVLRGLVATTDADIMVMGNTRTQHLVLPVGITSAILHGCDEAAVAQLGSRSHVEGLHHAVESHVSVVAHVSAAFLSALGGDDDDAVGCLRTVDGGCRGIAQHVDRLNIVGSYHRDVYSGDTVDDVVGLHGLSLAQRRGTAESD